jgi:hypothetical protein
MAEGRKSAPRNVSALPSEPEPELEIRDAIAQQHRGRRAGKRSDPAFRPTTVFVRKETQRRATRLLEDQDAGKDFSDLVEELLGNWIVKNSHA